MSILLHATSGIPGSNADHPRGEAQPVWMGCVRNPDRRSDLRCGSLDGGGSASGRSSGEALEVTAVLHSRGLWPPQSGPGRRNRWTGGPVHIGKGLQVYLSFQCQRMGMYGK